MDLFKAATLLCLLCGPAPLLAGRLLVVPESAPQNVESTEGPAYYAEHAYIPGFAEAPRASAPAAAAAAVVSLGSKPSPATARQLQGWRDVFSRENLQAIYGSLDNAPPALLPDDLIAPESEASIFAAAPAPDPAAVPVSAPAVAPKTAPTAAPIPASAAAPKRASAAAPKLAPAPAPAQPQGILPPVDTELPSDLMSLFAGYRDGSRASKAGAGAGTGRKLLQGFADVFTPAELQAMFGPPEAEEGPVARAHAPAAAAATAEPAPAARNIRGRQLLQPMSLEEQLVWRALKKAVVDTEAEQAQADFERVIEEMAVAPGPAADDSSDYSYDDSSQSRRRLQQDPNSPDFPNKLFDMAFQLAPSGGPVQPDAAGAPERALVPMAIPTRGLLQDDSSSGYADMEDLVSLPDVVLPVDVKVKRPEAAAPAPAPQPAGETLTSQPAPSVQ